jgi:hypothetical protein
MRAHAASISGLGGGRSSTPHDLGVRFGWAVLHREPGGLPALRLGLNQGRATRYAARQLVDALRARHARLAAELDADTRLPADIRHQPAAACSDASRDLVKPPPRLRVIDATLLIGRVVADPLPDRERQLGLQTVALSLNDRVETISLAWSLELGRVHPACHRPHFARPFALEMSRVYRC